MIPTHTPDQIITAALVAILKEEGYTIVPTSEWILWLQYRIDQIQNRPLGLVEDDSA